MTRRRLLSLIPALLSLSLGCAPAISSTRPVPDPVVILISFDGWRNDYTDLAKVPNLKALAARGVRSEALLPSFPTKTYPNHYTIVTGLYPANHGVISNNMWDDDIGQRFTMAADTAKDARWWKGEPLWVTAIKQGRKASSMFWPGSEVEIGGVRPTEWKPFDDKYPNDERIRNVLTWLGRPSGERPSFITLYFSDIDHAGHDFGPASPEALETAARLDGYLGDLVAGIDKLGLRDTVTIVVISDHGMSPLAPERRIFLDDYIDLATVNVVDMSPILHIAPKEITRASVDALYKSLYGRHPALDIYRREDVPARLHFRNNSRIQPIIGIADDGWAITTRERFATTVREGRLSKGDHGYDPGHRSMRALFVAAGPALRSGLVTGPFENVHLYEFMCRILGLKPARNDGRPSATRAFFR